MVLSWGPGSKGAKIYDSVSCAMSTPARPPRVVPLNAGVVTCPCPEASTRHRSIRTIAANSRERNSSRDCWWGDRQPEMDTSPYRLDCTDHFRTAQDRTIDFSDTTGSRYRWEQGLAEVRTSWRAECAYNQPDDNVFASVKMHGKQPIWPNSAMEDHIRPAAKRAGITKRIGWHTLRDTFGRLLKANGEDVATVQALMRHANVSVTMNTYVQAVTPANRKAQRGVIKQIREVAPDGPRSKSEMPASA